jgi:formate dehydrogenase (NADP+) alpha subunit
MATITITLDGREVSGRPGLTVLELARETGILIPTLCDDPKLKPVGACRICIVENEANQALLASCVTPIAAGMVIQTASPRVLERRRLLLRMMLASHPDSCMVCDKGNHCQLRSTAAAMGVGFYDLERLPQPAQVVDVNPLIGRDMGKCILCARCLRADQEVVVVGALDYQGRGFSTHPATLGDQPLEASECTFCGTCVSVCPTGALLEQDPAYRGTSGTTVDSVCPYCGCGCALTLEVKDRHIVRSRPRQETLSRGELCVRGAYGLDFVHSNERLTVPQLRTAEGFQTTDWDTALAHTAAEFNRIKAAYGADSLAVLGAAKGSNEENYLLQRLARTGFGTNNIDNGSRLYAAASREGLGMTLGFPGTVGTLEDLERADLILVVGADLTHAAPLAGYAVKRAVKYRGGRLIVVDPRRTEITRFAGLHLRPRPGSDAALFCALARVIADEELYDHEFVTRRTDNFAELLTNLTVCDVKHVAAVTGVPAGSMRQAARHFAAAERVAVIFGSGITEYPLGAQAVTALANLTLLCGNLGQHSGGIFALMRDAGAQGAADMGALPDCLPGYRALNDAGRQLFEERWGCTLPVVPGRDAPSMLAGARDGSIKGMLIVGENPVVDFPDPDGVTAALANLEYLAVLDIFPTETAALAGVVLPGTASIEKEGTYTNFEGRVQLARQALPPPGECRADWTVILDLAARLGAPMPYASVAAVREEIGAAVPFYRHGAVVDPEAGIQGSTPSPATSRRLYNGAFPSGFQRFTPVPWEPPPGAAKDYPLTLITGSARPHFGGGTRSQRSVRLRRFAPAASVQITPRDAGRLGIREGDTVKLISAHGEIKVCAMLSDTLPESTLYLPHGFPDAPVNRLFGVIAKSCRVRIERSDPDV